MSIAVRLNSIDPDGVYSPRELARAMGTGTQSVYRPIREGKLRAAKLNDRGDLRVLGRWAIAYLESRAALVNPQVEGA